MFLIARKQDEGHRHRRGSQCGLDIVRSRWQRLHQRGKFAPRHDKSRRNLTDEYVENLFHEADVREEVRGQVSVFHAFVPMIICLLVVVVVMLLVREYSSVRMSA